VSDLEFVQVGDLAREIRKDVLTLTDDLVSRSLVLHYEDGSVTQFTFTSASDLEWVVLEGPDKGASGRETYTAVRPREDIYLVDYLSSREASTSVDIVLDLGSGQATTVVGTLPTLAEVQKSAFALATEGSDLTAVRARFLAAAIDKPFSVESHTQRPTDEMVGKRVQYVYGPTEAYEHIYLTDKLYTWHCLAGIEKDLADTDRCHYYKLGEQLYLFVWREKIVPTMGLVVADWGDAKRSMGKLWGYETADFGTMSNAMVGADATVLNSTVHPGLDD
jgi:hypothetical protein